MKPEEQVASLELSKELVELGLKRESYFGYFDFGNGIELYPAKGIIDGYRLWALPTYTVAELLDILSRFGPALEYDGLYWDCYVRDIALNGVDETPANALAELLAEMIKEGEVTIEELNNV